MNTIKQNIFCVLCCLGLLVAAGTSHAQNESPEVHKKIVIVKKTIDENGNVNEETTVLEGEEAENFNMDELPAMEEGAHQFDIRVESSEIENFNWVEEGSENTEININGEHFIFSEDMESLDDLPEDVKAKLAELNINIEELSDGKEKRIMMFKSSHVNDNKAFLGVMIDESQDLKSGLMLSDIVKESAAEKAGLKAGDVLTKVDGKAVNTYEELVEVLKDKKVGDDVNLEYKRGTSVRTSKASLSERKMQIQGLSGDEDVFMLKRQNSCGDWNKESIEERFMRGKSMGDCDWSKCDDKNGMSDKPFLGVYLSDEIANGALIDGAVKGSAAASIGMQKGDVITKLNKVKINSSTDLQNAVKALTVGKNVKVTYLRNGSKERATAVLGASPKSGCMPMSCCPEKGDKKKGKKSITIIKENGASSTVIERRENLKPASTRLELQSIELFPNPNKGTFKISFESEQLVPTTISILNINGKEVFREEIKDFRGEYSNELNITRFSKGTYLLNIIQDDKVYTEKIIYN